MSSHIAPPPHRPGGWADEVSSLLSRSVWAPKPPKRVAKSPMERGQKMGKWAVLTRCQVNLDSETSLFC